MYISKYCMNMTKSEIPMNFYVKLRKTAFSYSLFTWEQGRSSLYLEVHDVIESFCWSAFSEGRPSINHLIGNDSEGPPVTLRAIGGFAIPTQLCQHLWGHVVRCAHREPGIHLGAKINQVKLQHFLFKGISVIKQRFYFPTPLPRFFF